MAPLKSLWTWLRKLQTTGFGVFVGILTILLVTGIVVFVWPNAQKSAQPQAWQAVFNLAGFIVFLGSVVAVIPVARHDVDTNDTFAAGLVATAALIPTTVTEFSTVAAYVTPTMLAAFGWTKTHTPWVIWIHNLALLIGASAGIVAWVFWGLFNRQLVRVDRQNASVYAALRERYMLLRAAFCSVRTAELPSDASA